MIHNQWDTYADLYDNGIGIQGDTLHTKFIDPVIFQFLGKTEYGSILDAGCGNGYLLRKLSSHARNVIGVDNSNDLLSIASKNTTGLQRVTTKYADLSKNLPFDSQSFNVIVASMVLQYLSSLHRFASESSRLLNKHGVLIVIVNHPGHALFLRAQEFAGKKNDKFITSGSYFSIGKRRKKSLWDKAILEYYHRPTEGYINLFTPYFHLDKITEVTEDGEMPRILGLKWIKV